MIIALTGKKGSGKDYAGSIISKVYGGSVKSFADPVRFKVKLAFNLESDAKYDKFKRSVHNIMGRSVHGRQMVLGLGMAMREVNSTFPLEYMSQFIGQDIIITDLRFDNEYNWCVANNAIIIKIVSADDQSDDHISERGFDDHLCDGVVFNYKDDSFSNDLQNTIDTIIEKRFK